MDDLVKEWDVLRESLPDDHAEAAEILFDRCDLMADRIEALEAEMEARIAEAVKAEREACAAVAEAVAVEIEGAAYRVLNVNSRSSLLARSDEADAIAEMIRARGRQ